MRERAMKVLEPDRHAPQIFRIGVADNEEMIGADTAPAVACLRRDGRENKENSYDEGDGSS